MHGFHIVLDDQSEGFFEDEHARYLLLFEQLLTETATSLNVTPLKQFDGFAEAESTADGNADPSDTIAWLNAYNRARDRTPPTWFDPSDALKQLTPVLEEIGRLALLKPDDDIDYLIESLEVLERASQSGAKFCMALM